MTTYGKTKNPQAQEIALLNYASETSKTSVGTHSCVNARGRKVTRQHSSQCSKASTATERGRARFRAGSRKTSTQGHGILKIPVDFQHFLDRFLLRQ